MTNKTGREAVSENSAFGVNAALANRAAAASRSDRDAAQAVAHLRKRAESRVEKELDAFWENVPI
jgi:hypothetical protein